MKTMKSLGLAAVLFLILILPLRANDSGVKAMWVWNSSHALTEEQRKELIGFSIHNDINLLFVGTNRSLPDQAQHYADLIYQAHANGIRVFALAGDASWALEANHEAVLDWVKTVLDFNANQPETAFDGIQLDIEPYLLPEFAEQTQEIGSQFLQVLETAAQLIADRGSRLEFNAAIPFWYASGESPVIVEYKGAGKPLSRHILDMLDSVSIMAYRDHAEEQIRLAIPEIEYAGSLNKKAYIGFETMPPSGDAVPAWITYNGKSMSYMYDQMEAVMRHFAGHPGFGGIAVHHYETFKTMQESELRTLEQQFQELKSAGIVTGYLDGSAGFGNKATRAEISAIVARMKGVTNASLVKPEHPRFLDVNQNHWSYGWVETASQLGLISGRDKQHFEPDAYTTLEEALVALARTADIPEIAGASVPGASPWAQGWIQAMVNHKLIEPRNDYKKELTREELVLLVYRTYQYIS
jgi:hypothetical protein